MKKLLQAGCLLGLMLVSRAAIGADTQADQTLTKVGQVCPPIEVTMMDGKAFNLKQLHGKVVLLSFWATWCPPCNAEMPRLEADVWQKYKDKNFAMVAISREETPAVITAFNEKKKFTFPLAADPKRDIYKQFALSLIPRTYIIDGEGKIAYQSIGYSAGEFDQMLAVLQKEIDKSTAKTGATGAN